MGCNCKGGKGEVNPLDSVDYITNAKNTYNEFISGKTINEIPEIDWIMILQTYNSLYPRSSSQPDKQGMVDAIRQAIELYDVKYQRKYGRRR